MKPTIIAKIITFIQLILWTIVSTLFPVWLIKILIESIF